MEAAERLVEKYRQRGGIKDPVYAAMIEGMDRAIGRFLTELYNQGLRDNTLVIFKSDNGGYNGDNRPLRGMKGMIFEGGIRIPWMVRWPGVVRPNTWCLAPVVSTDCYPTLLAAAGIELHSGEVPDGKNLMPLLRNESGFESEAIYFHYSNHAFHKRNRLASAIRVGKYNLIRRYDDDSRELYNLVDDIGERTNLATQKPKLTKRFDRMLSDWLEDVGATFPTRQ